MRSWLGLLIVGGLMLAACEPDRLPAQPPDPVTAALTRLRSYESGEREQADFASRTRDRGAFGPDPYALVSVADQRHVGLLRGRDRLVLLDDAATPLADVAVLEDATGLAVWPDHGMLAVVSERSTAVARYRVEGDGITALEPLEVPGARALTAVSWGDDGALYVVDGWTDRLHVARVPAKGAEDGSWRWSSQPICAAPLSIQRLEDHLFVSCLVDRAVVVRRIDAEGMPDPGSDQRVAHDGPIWSMAARREPSGTWSLALGGVEDHPLDRSEGFFGYIDSFVYLYRLDDNQDPKRLAVHNVSELGVVTPKALAFRGDELIVTGYGGERAASLELPELTARASWELPPGTRQLVPTPEGFILANPLLDAWMTWAPGKPPKMQRLDRDTRTTYANEVRLGESMLFTTMMAPKNSSDGAHSRFTCETCHLEAYVDGRTHHTGRGEVHATTKPLYGLFNNKPHFTRALDPDLTQVSHAEFRVAGKGSGLDPWFSLSVEQHPWLGEFPAYRSPLTPFELRRSLLTFLMANLHRANPLALRSKHFSAAARGGAKLFRERCVACHAARLITDDPETEVPFDRWESLILSEAGPLVWASEGYHKTGVEPYVHLDGARTSSLRRLYKKRPYFTDGSAKTLADVLSAVRFEGDGFWHRNGPAGASALDERQRAELLAFIELL